jgi:putative membrane protein
MLWLLVLHISALLFWCASLLYLPTLIAGHKAVQSEVELQSLLAPGRILFTYVVTPAGLLAIVSGTTIFIIQHITSIWLMVKLLLVSGLVVCHALNGWLILRVEQGATRQTALLCRLLTLASSLLIIAIITVVLMKPF